MPCQKEATAPAAPWLSRSLANYYGHVIHLRTPYTTPVLLPFRLPARQARTRQNQRARGAGDVHSKEASMTGRNKRASLRVRLAIAAAVLVGGGAAAVAGVTATHSN